MPKYDHKKIEAKWKKSWEKSKIYKTSESSDKPKYYVLDMFPYPSGAGLHVGHPKGYIATDIVARMKMMQGYNVLHPMGWDAFGLPAENYALKNKVHPAEATAENVKVFKRQLGLLGFTYDWDREVNTTDPEYYKWTQWIFLQLFKKGLAFESYEPINWCPSCKTGLANEDLEDGKCERCGSVVEQKPMRQWVLKITDYAERLLNDIELLKEWPEPIKEMQRNWIGKSEGMLFSSPVKDTDIVIQSFNSHFEPFCADTFVVIAPDHPLLPKLVAGTPTEKEVLKKADEITKARAAAGYEEKEMDGIFTGRYTVDPVGNGELPIWVASYALANYGTGIVKCSAHDERDFAFAKKFGIKLKPVLFPHDSELRQKVERQEICYTDMKNGVLTEPAAIAGPIDKDTRSKVVKFLEENKLAVKKVNYKLRDWVFSRQRYWGEPIPLVHCEVCATEGLKISSVFTFHAIGGSSADHWHPWLDKELKRRGIKSITPDLPNTNSPVLADWLEVANKFYGKELNGDSIVVGRSLGARAALKFAESHKLKKLILICPTLDGGKKYWAEVAKQVPGFPVEADEKCNAVLVDYKQVEKNVQDIIFLFSHDDPYIRREFEEHYRKHFTKATFVVYEKAGHFGSQDGFAEFPRLLDLIIGANNGWYPIPEEDLPLELPKVKNYEPTGTGESPLAGIDKWVNTKCPHCGGQAKRETNTMPQWAGSCWYYLRYEDPYNDKELVSKEKEKYWSPVDLYVGGAEHATRHLIYARFWHKFLFDIGAVANVEPFTKLQNVGLILAEDGRKMSKRWNNVINPDDVVAEFGADSMRLYEMFMGPFDQACAWSTKGVIGCRRFLEKVWVMSDQFKSQNSKVKITSQNSKLEILLNQTIKKVSEDISGMRFNTAISQLMIFANEASNSPISNIQYQIFIQLLAPFAPHLCEELWSALGNKDSIFKSAWPQYDKNKIQSAEITVVIQVNGKVRDEMIVPVDISEADVKIKALASEKIQKWLEGKEPKKVIYVKGKLVSIVV